MSHVACVASVSVGLSARWRRFSLFGCPKIGASRTRTFLRRPNFPAAKKSEKCIERAESLTETLATQARYEVVASFICTAGDNIGEKEDFAVV